MVRFIASRGISDRAQPCRCTREALYRPDRSIINDENVKGGIYSARLRCVAWPLRMEVQSYVPVG
jgi:hypothetical protein